MQTSDDGVHTLQSQNHVGVPVEEQIHFGGTTARYGSNLLQARHAIYRLFDGPRDGNEHLVDGHDAVVHADDDARKIGVRKYGDRDRKSEVASHKRHADGQEQHWLREPIEPKCVRTILT